MHNEASCTKVKYSNNCIIFKIVITLKGPWVITYGFTSNGLYIRGVELILFKRTLCVLGLTFVVAGYGKSVDLKPEVVSPPNQVSAESKDRKVELARTDNGFVISAINPAEGDLFKGITIQTKDQSKVFAWNTSSNPAYYPTVKVGDFYIGNKDELAIILTKGHGTGVLQQEIHVLNLGDLSEIAVENPIEAIKRDVKSKVTKGDKTIAIELEANGARIKKEYERSAAGSWSENVVFGDMVNFMIDENKIFANLPGAISPAPHIVATAVVEYGNDLRAKRVNLIEEK
jgi:hypothetical protein